MDKAILVLNSGSSSIKFALFAVPDLHLLYHGKIKNIFEAPQFKVFNQSQQLLAQETIPVSGYDSSFEYLFNWLRGLPHSFSLKAVGHRVVHGGTFFLAPCLINELVIEQIDSLTPLAPLHQPLNVKAIRSIKKLYPPMWHLIDKQTLGQLYRQEK